MNQQEFETVFEKLTLRRSEVLQGVLLGNTDAEIAGSMNIRPTTVRKHIERVCQEFGLDNGEKDERRYKRSDLIALFAKYKPELLSGRTFERERKAVGIKIVETGKVKNIHTDKEIFSTTPLLLAEAEQQADEFNSSTLQLLLGIESAEELLNKELQILSNEQERIQRAKILNKIGYYRYLEGNFKTASFYLRWAIKFNPEMGVAHYNLGLTNERLCDISQARHHYEIAREQIGQAADSATNNLARLEIRQNNYETAVELINAILPRVKDTGVKASLHKNMGWADYELKLYAQAKEHLLISLSLNNNYAPAYYLLAKVQEATNDRENASISFRNFLNHDSSQQNSSGEHWRLPEQDDWHSEALNYFRNLNTKSSEN